MRIFQVNTVYNTGSTGRIVADLKHFLEKNENECYVSYGKGHSLENNTYCVSNRMDLYGHALFTRMTGRTGFFSRYSTKKLIRIIKEFQPDIVHLHNIHGYYLHVDLLFQFLKEYGKPVIWTLHDCWSYTGQCGYYEQYGNYLACDKWKNKCAQCDRLAEYPKSFRDSSEWNYEHKKLAFTGVDKLVIVTVSEWLRKQVLESFLKDYPVYTIYNGVDLEKFRPLNKIGLRERFGLKNKKIVLGVANIWSELKGLVDFVKLVEYLDMMEYQIVLLGIEDKKMAEIPSDILALPRTEKIEELVAWYNVAEVHFVASRAETFGMTVIEALACGTPVVSYNICAMSEILGNGCGYVVEHVGDVKTAADMIARCDKGKMELACRERSKRFEKEIQNKKYMELYRAILNGLL